MVCHQYFKFVYCTVHLLVFWGPKKCPNGHQYKWRAWMPSSQLIFPRIWKISDRCKTFEKTERLSGPGRPFLKFNLREDFPAINHLLCSFSDPAPVNSAGRVQMSSKYSPWSSLGWAFLHLYFCQLSKKCNNLQLLRKLATINMVQLNILNKVQLSSKLYLSSCSNKIYHFCSNWNFLHNWSAPMFDLAGLKLKKGSFADLRFKRLVRLCRNVKWTWFSTKSSVILAESLICEKVNILPNSTSQKQKLKPLLENV